MWVNIKDYTKNIVVSDILLEYPDTTNGQDPDNDTLEHAEKYLVTKLEPALELTHIKQIKGNFLILNGLVVEKSNVSSLKDGIWWIDTQE